MTMHPTVIPMADDSKRISREDITPTILPDDYLKSAVADSFRAFHMPRYNELPAVDLYRDQVIAFVEQTLGPMNIAIDGVWLSPSMVNNYVKIGLVAPPKKKLYGREQIARLLVVCVFKQVLDIPSIQTLFRIQKMTYMTDIAYDYVACELEGTLHAAFAPKQEVFPDSAHQTTRESLLVRSAVTAFVSKIYLVGYLRYIGFDKKKRV